MMRFLRKNGINFVYYINFVLKLCAPFTEFAWFTSSHGGAIKSGEAKQICPKRNHLFQINKKWNSSENLHSMQWLAITCDDLWHSRVSSSVLSSFASFFQFYLWIHKQLSLEKQVVALSLQKTFTQFMRLPQFFYFFVKWNFMLIIVLNCVQEA